MTTEIMIGVLLFLSCVNICIGYALLVPRRRKRTESIQRYRRIEPNWKRIMVETSLKEACVKACEEAGEE